MVVEVALDLEAEELGGDHQARLAVPGGKAVGGRVGAEGARRVLVEADHDPEVAGAGPDGMAGRHQRRPAGGASVAHVDERQAGEAEVGHHGIGVAAVPGAAEGEVDVGPADAGVGQSRPDGVHTHGPSGDTVVAPEGMDADPDDGDATAGRAHARSASTGAKA